MAPRYMLPRHLALGHRLGAHFGGRRNAAAALDLSAAAGLFLEAAYCSNARDAGVSARRAPPRDGVRRGLRYPWVVSSHSPGDLLLGRYRLDVALGSGGAATVWRARDTRLGRPVAIKVLPRRLRSAAAAVAEARAVAALSNPHIVALYEFAEDDAEYYLVTEVIDGTTLENVLADHSLASDEAAAVLAPIAHALAAAHAAGVVHGDVKPANILLGREGQIKLADFGAAAWARTGGKRTATVEASPAYAAPEVLGGATPGAAADLYNLGATLARAVGGRAAGGPLPKGASGALRATVALLTEDDPRDRPEGAEAVADELELIGAEVDRRLLVRHLASSHAMAEPVEIDGPSVEAERTPRWREDVVARIWPALVLSLAVVWSVGRVAGWGAWSYIPAAAVAAAALFWPWEAGIAALVLAAAGTVGRVPLVAALLIVVAAPVWVLAGRRSPLAVLAPLLVPLLALGSMSLAAAAILAKTLRPRTAIVAAAVGSLLLPVLWTAEAVGLHVRPITSLFAASLPWRYSTRWLALQPIAAWSIAIVAATALLALAARGPRWVGPATMVLVVVAGFALVDWAAGTAGAHLAATSTLTYDLSLSLIIGAVVMSAAREPSP